MRVLRPQGAPDRNVDLRKLYQTVREASTRLGAPLSDADATVQSMPDASPAKWHLAHTTWFFERMILEQNLPGYCAFDREFNFLFNSYYESIGARQPRPRRGMITRPSLDTVMAYRDHVDRAMASLMQDDLSSAVADLIELGCNHEQQHQELLLTDILHLFAQNPLRPAYKDPGPIAVAKTDSAPPGYLKFDGGVVEIGHDGAGFAFDCEGPRHRALVEPYELADRLVTNAEWMAFIADGGYRTPLHLALGRMGDGANGRLDGAALLGRARGRLLVDDLARRAARRSRRAGHACQLLRGGRVRHLGRPKIAERVRMGARGGSRAAQRQFRRVRTPAPCRGPSRTARLAPDLRRRVGMDAQRLRSLSAISVRRRARSANTTASSCAGSSCCAAARARRRRATCGPLIAISSRPTRAGSSRG